MNYKYISIVFAGVALTAASVMPAMAQQTAASSTRTAARAMALEARIAKAKTHADQELDRRVTSLNALATRVNDMKKITDAQKSSLTAAITDQVNTVTALKAKIDADTDVATLRADIQSITKSYRIYALILPQASLVAAADRAMDVASSMSALAGKLQARISTLQTSGTDVTALQAAYADFNLKIADANTQANAAVTEAVSLKPDNGDKTVMAANVAALKDARKKVQAAQQDLVVARKDAETIVRGIRKDKGNASSSDSSASYGDQNGTSTEGSH